MANLVGTATWQDLQKAQHERAFVVAGAMKADLLEDLSKAVLKAADEGKGLEEFRRQFREIVQTRGWHGWTGEGTAKGEAWRTRVIYQTNMATSYASGRMAQLRDGKFSIWVYKHGNAKDPRIQHLAWDGVALPPDHPFWETHAPPNGWGCTCRIRGANSDAGVRRAGGDPGKRLPDGWDAISPKTGAPVGIDKGWDYKVGAAAADDLAQLVARKAADLPTPLAKDLTAEVAPVIGKLATVSPTTPEEAITAGRKLVADLRAGNAPLAADLDEGRFTRAASALRADLHRLLSQAEGFGAKKIKVVRGTSAQARSVMQDVAKMLPGSWVQKGNAEPIGVKIQQSWHRGGYRPKTSDAPARIATSASSTAVHEYLHHLQFTMPELDQLFREIHRRRTVGESLTEIYVNSGEMARRDGYYDAYQGKEYPGFGPLEVLTMALQPLLGSDEKSLTMLKEMMERDPEMLEFALGMLFYWRP